jgi:hypothetical protein
VTRHLSALSIDRHRYSTVFGTDVYEDYANELFAAEQQELFEISYAAITFAPQGMFYADSMAAVLAHRQVGRGGSAAGCVKLSRMTTSAGICSVIVWSRFSKCFGRRDFGNIT